MLALGLSALLILTPGPNQALQTSRVLGGGRRRRARRLACMDVLAARDERLFDAAQTAPAGVSSWPC